MKIKILQREVRISATGLAPNSTHPEHIHAGTCTSMPMRAIVYTLNPLKASTHGVGTSVTTQNTSSFSSRPLGGFENVFYFLRDLRQQKFTRFRIISAEYPFKEYHINENHKGVDITKE